MHTIDTLIAKYLIFFCALGVLYFFFTLPTNLKKRFLIEAVIGGILALVIAKIGSKLFYNPRPFIAGHFTPYFTHANDNGFPSDHTLLSSFMGYLLLKYNKKWGYTLLGLAAVIGLSRVVAGVHHLIDIVGSFVCAGLAMGIVYLIGHKFFPISVPADKDNPTRPRRRIHTN
jgi:undecaprenyl-diphosphatase